jgi:hypothetical protein
LTKESIIGATAVLQSIEAPGECSGRLAAALADSHGVARSFEDTDTPA